MQGRISWSLKPDFKEHLWEISSQSAPEKAPRAQALMQGQSCQPATGNCRVHMQEAPQELGKPELVTKCNSDLTAGFPIQCDKSRRHHDTKGFVVAALGFFVPSLFLRETDWKDQQKPRGLINVRRGGSQVTLRSYPTSLLGNPFVFLKTSKDKQGVWSQPTHILVHRP